MPSFFNHFIHPLTYTAKGEQKRYLSPQENSRVLKLVLASFALTAFEAFYCSRSLKTSLVTIGIITGAVFYLATAIMKMMSEESSSSSKKDPLPEERRDAKPSPSAEIEKQAPLGTQVDPFPPADSQPTSPSLKSSPRANQEVQRVILEKPPIKTADQKTQREPPVYDQLALNNGEDLVIYKIIQSMGDMGWFALLSMQGEMIANGKKIEHVHPLKFLEIVLKNPTLKQSMITIEKDFLKLKWNGFIKGFGSSQGFATKCNQVADQDKFALYIDGFCKAVEADPEQVRSFIAGRKWEELIRFLIKK